MVYTGNQSAKSLYESCSVEREQYLRRAKDASALTIPTLFPESGSTGATKFDTPYQSVGARGINNLSASLLLSLLPPNSPFFRLVLDDAAIEALGADPQIKTEIDSQLSSIERSLMKEIEGLSLRVPTNEAIKQLLVAGNTLLYLPKNGNMRVFRLDQYVIKRDPMGNPLKIMTHEMISPLALSEEHQELVGGTISSYEETVDLFTVADYTDKTVDIYQELNGVVLEDSIGSFKKEESPFIPLRMNRVDGESYGRGYVEEYQGDLQSLEGLTQAIVEGSAMAAKAVWLNNVNGTTDTRELALAANGDIIEGNSNDVSVLQMNKFADFRVAFETIAQIKERLNFAFLLTEASIRRAERVTAEEVRLVTQAIERQLGGIFSLLSQEFQMPLLNRLISKMKSEGKLPKLPKKYVTPTIITGMDALGRGQDLTKLDTFIAGIGQLLGPQVMSQFVNVREYLDRRAAALGIESDGLIKSEQQLAQEQQALQAQQAVSQMGPEVLRQSGETARAGM